MPYYLHVLFDSLRLVFCFIFIFGWLGPKFLPHARKLNGIDRFIYSCLGLGGLIIVATFVLTMLNVYDFISLFVCLIILPFFIELYNEYRSGTPFLKVFRVLENRLVARTVRFIENTKRLSLTSIREKYLKKPEFSFSTSRHLIAAIIIGACAGIIRIIPVIQSSAPFSRSWYFELEAVKNLRLQQYFGDIPMPKGMHSIVQLFSTITQVTPEMILHILGGLISFYLAILIYWIIRELTKGKRKVSALFGMGIYAFLPTLLLPVSLNIEGESNALKLALCFALPTAFVFLRNIRMKEKAPWFYVSIGVLATGLINVFVLVFILLPFLLFGLFTIPRRFFLRSFTRLFIYVGLIYIIALSPYLLYLLFKGIDITAFFELQFYNTFIFSYFPNLITDIEILALYYLGIGVFVLAGFIINHFVKREKHLGDIAIFLIMFCCVSFLYTPYFNFSFLIIDPDQLNSFYGVIIPVVYGLSFYAIFAFAEYVLRLKESISNQSQPVLMVLLISGALVWTGGIRISNDLPQTLPNGFFNAYYNIVNERLPYSYSTVGPEIDRTLAMNRHYFMNYKFFLENYAAIDSSYQQYLSVPIEQREREEVPPASIFLFVEKPPYNFIQQGILYESSTVMKDIEQWLISFQQLDNRTVKVYYESEDAIVYEIVNRKDESDLINILLNTQPKDDAFGSSIFK